jgi:heterotetrameric sarcosine oxidase delta subunit
MMLIPCPHCGPRAAAEFTFERPVESIVPLEATPDEAIQRLYTRENPRGPSLELWRHAYGCRGWIKLLRNTLTHEISDVAAMDGGA